MRSAARLRHLSRRTEDAYVAWIRRFILFHGKRHPDEMGSLEVVAFLSDLAVRRHVSASTQNQALAAILFLYRAVLGRELEGLGAAVRARVRTRFRSCSRATRCARCWPSWPDVHRLVATLLYGGGLRLLEALRLRVKDVDFARRQLLVREGKGNRDRGAPLPRIAETPLRRHLERVAACTATTSRSGVWGPPLPAASAQKYPNAPREWAWQWVFPATRTGVDPRYRPPLPPSPARDGGPARRQAGGRRGRHHQARQLPHLPALLRDPPARRRRRHPHRPGAPRTPGAPHHHDLHARPRAGPARRPQPGRQAVRRPSQHSPPGHLAPARPRLGFPSQHSPVSKAGAAC